MKEQAMNIKDYIYLYINSEALYRKWYCDTPPEQEPTWSKLTTKRFQLLNDLSIVKVEYALRRLSDMTEEEMKQLYLVRGLWAYITESHITNAAFCSHNDNLIEIYHQGPCGGTGYCAGMEKIYLNQLFPIQFHYLLKQGFDLFGLIDAGLAIDAKTIQPPTP